MCCPGEMLILEHLQQVELTKDHLIASCSFFSVMYFIHEFLFLSCIAIPYIFKRRIMKINTCMEVRNKN